MDKAEMLAKKYKVEDLLRPILIFKLAAGDRSPPPAPKHTTAASNRPKAVKPTQPKRVPSKWRQTTPRLKLTTLVPVIRREEIEENYDNISEQLHDNDSPDNTTVVSDSIIDDDHHGRKRKREGHLYNELSHEDQQHTMWADSVLDYFMLTSEDTWGGGAVFPGVPPYIDLERPVDTEGHTALHWAAAMGDIDVCKDLLGRRLASPEARNMRGETPLIRAAMFANCYDRGVWAKMLSLFEKTIMISDDLGGTILHHICYTTAGGTKSHRARHYLEVVLARVKEAWSPDRFVAFCNSQDRHGDTPFHIACRLSRRCTKVFQAFGLPSNIRNHNGETVDYYLHEKAMARRGVGAGSGGGPTELSLLQSSSPVTGDRFGAPSPHRFAGPQLPTASLKTAASKTFNRGFQSLLSTQIADFLQAGEADLATKENLRAEAQRALQRTEADLAYTRQRIAERHAAEARDGAHDIASELQFHTLLSEAEKLEEQMQHRALHALVQQEEHGAQFAPEEDVAAERARKIAAMRAIVRAQTERREKTRRMVEARADAGMGPKGEQMKGIILQTLAVSREHLEQDVDALIEHMELERGGEEAGTGAGMTEIGGGAMEIDAH